MTSDQRCTQCSLWPETLDHLPRQCSKTLRIWHSINLLVMALQHFGLPYTDWMFCNLKQSNFLFHGKPRPYSLRTFCSLFGNGDANRFFNLPLNLIHIHLLKSSTIFRLQWMLTNFLLARDQHVFYRYDGLHHWLIWNLTRMVVVMITGKFVLVDCFVTQQVHGFWILLITLVGVLFKKLNSRAWRLTSGVAGWL